MFERTVRLLMLLVVVLLGSCLIQSQAAAQYDPEEIAKLLAYDGAAGDGFGLRVSISGDAAIVGAPGDDDMGAAYLFEGIGGVWFEVAKLVASDRAEGDRFGFAVSVSGDAAVVGAEYDDDDGTS